MVRIALIGLGEIARTAHLPALNRNPDVHLVAAADLSQSRREQWSKLLGPNVDLAADLDGVLGRDDLDAVVLATPPWVTPELAIRATRHAVFVLAEKPVATSVREAAVYETLTDAERARVQVGLAYRHDPAMVELRNAIAAGDLGKPLLVRAHIYDEQRTSDNAHSSLIEHTLAHGSPVVHEGAHVFDWLRFLLGGDGDVRDAWALRTRTELPAPNLVGARLAYPDNAEVLVEFGWLTDAIPRCELSFLGDRGHAVLDGQTFELTITKSDGTRTVAFPGQRADRCFDLQLDRFVELVKGERATAEPSLDDGLRALALSERISVAALAAASRRTIR